MFVGHYSVALQSKALQPGGDLRQHFESQAWPLEFTELWNFGSKQRWLSLSIRCLNNCHGQE
jgi:hypothetical protein